MKEHYMKKLEKLKFNYEILNRNKMYYSFM